MQQVVRIHPYRLRMRRSGGKNKGIMRVSGKAGGSITVTNGNSSAALFLQPSTTGRLNNIEKGFEYYRFVKARFTIVPITRFETTVPDNTTAGYGAFGYYPEETTATTTTLAPANVLSLDASIPLQASVSGFTITTPLALYVQGHTVNQILNVPKSVLLSTPAKWYRTNATASAEDPFVQQGTLFVAFNDTAGANTIVVPFVLDYVCEFAGRVDSSTFTVFHTPLQLVEDQADDDYVETESKTSSTKSQVSKQIVRRKVGGP